MPGNQYLEIDIYETRATPLPNRRLEIAFRIRNNDDYEMVVIDSWISVSAFSTVISEGRLFQLLDTRIPSRKTGNGRFHLEMPSSLISFIEKKRIGGDVKLGIRSSLRVSTIIHTNESEYLAPPHITGFGFGDSYIEHTIAQSDWIDILRQLDWSEMELIEIPFSKFKYTPELHRAIKEFEEAQKCIRKGDWKGTLAKCRTVFEIIVHDHEEDLKESLAALNKILPKGEKTIRFNMLIHELGKFQHLGRHDIEPNVGINRPDAELSLLMTSAMIKYLGDAF